MSITILCIIQSYKLDGNSMKTISNPLENLKIYEPSKPRLKEYISRKIQKNMQILTPKTIDIE